MKQRPHKHHLAATRRQQLGILGRLFGADELHISIKSQDFSFDTVEKFRTFLSGKTDIPAAKMQEMLDRNDSMLKEEIKQLEQIENNINERLAATIRDPKSVDSYLDDATMVRFSQDYDWRQIMFELSKQSTDFSEYKLEAVNHYLKYVRSRIDVGLRILRDREQSRQPPEDRPTMMDTMETRAIEGISDAMRSSRQSSEQAVDPAFMSTSCIDLSQMKDEKIAPSELTRLPRGQSVKVDISKTTQLPFKIASRKFVIDSRREPITLLSKTGDSYPLKPGENLIGRSTKCSIILNPEFVDISRQHLIIEVYPDKTLHMTDLSSSGTRIPSNLIKP